MILREFRIAAANGAALGVLIGLGTLLIFHRPDLSFVIGAAMLINNLVAGLSGVIDSRHARSFPDRPCGIVGGVRDDDDRLHGLLLVPRAVDLAELSLAQPYREDAAPPHQSSVRGR